MTSPVPKNAEPLTVFSRWFEEASASETSDPEAMALATCGPDGMPSARTVLLKGLVDEGFTFYTNLESRKAKDLAANPQAALLFHWKSLGRQVRVEGGIEPLGREANAQYYHSRPRESQIGAWASLQSSPLDDYKTLENRVAEYTRKFDGREVLLPEYWGGYLLRPRSIEFWVEGEFRLHCRTRFTRATDEEAWSAEHLYP